jgi:hypothetical protein
MTDREWKIINPGGSRRGVITKKLARVAAPAAIEEATP